MTFQQAQADFASGTMSRADFDAFMLIYSRKQVMRRMITMGVFLVLVLLLSLAFCGRGNKSATATPSPTDPPATVSSLQRVETAVRAGIAGLTSRVEAFEKKPTPKAKAGVSQRAVSQLASQVQILTDQLGGQGRRLDVIESAISRSLAAAPPPPPEPEEELKELTDEELAEQYRRAVLRGKLPD